MVSMLRILAVGFLVIAVLSQAPSQAVSSKGYLMSPMTYDSLGFHLSLDVVSGKAHGDFKRLLVDQCVDILRANGIRPAVFRDSERVSFYPCIEIDLTIVPLDRVRYVGDEMFFGTISFRRDVTMLVALRPVWTIGSTWSKGFGGQASNRFMILGEVEERMRDFVKEYVEMNSATALWKRANPK
jgi:hypothetical protein